MGSELMPQYYETEHSHEDRDEHAEFSSLLAENCSSTARDIIRESIFIKEYLRDIKNHDKKTFLHSLEVVDMAAFLVENLEDKLTEEDGSILMRAALLHDYGKVDVDFEILNKEDELTSLDTAKIKEHPRVSFNTLKDWDIKVAKVVASHHEYQKNPYPRNYSSENIVLLKDNRIEDMQTVKLSRILAMIDAFQSMIDADRPSNKERVKPIQEIADELNGIFELNEDKEIIFLLEAYYHKKINEEKLKNSQEQIH